MCIGLCFTTTAQRTQAVPGVERRVAAGSVSVVSVAAVLKRGSEGELLVAWDEA